MIIKACKFIKKQTFNIEVTNENFLEVRVAMEKETRKYINKLKQYQAAGLIGSISFPRNKYIQKELDDIVRKKKILKKSTEQINKIFLK